MRTPKDIKTLILANTYGKYGRYIDVQFTFGDLEAILFFVFILLSIVRETLNFLFTGLFLLESFSYSILDTMILARTETTSRMKKKYFCLLIIKLVGRKLYVSLMNCIDRHNLSYSDTASSFFPGIYLGNQTTQITGQVRGKFHNYIVGLQADVY